MRGIDQRHTPERPANGSPATLPAGAVERADNRTPEPLTLGDESTPERERTARIHIVQAGDTAWGLAERYLGDGRRVAELAQANPQIRNFSDLKVGQQIRVPEARERSAAEPSVQPATYTVRKGDTLSEISERLLGRADRFNQILALNPGLKPEELQPGQVIKVPAKSEVVIRAASAAPAPGGAGLTTSTRALDLIKSAETFRSRTYTCPSGELTIGYGTTQGVQRGMTVTEAQAVALLRRDVRAAEATIRQMVKVPLNQNQFDALVSFVHNIGETQFRTSTMLRLLNGGNYAAAAREFPRWNKADGEVLGGLVTRRAAEQRLFNEAPPGRR